MCADDEVQHMRTNADSDEVQEEDELMEYQSQEPLNGNHDNNNYYWRERVNSYDLNRGIERLIY